MEFNPDPLLEALTRLLKLGVLVQRFPDCLPNVRRNLLTQGRDVRTRLAGLRCSAIDYAIRGETATEHPTDARTFITVPLSMIDEAIASLDRLDGAVSVTKCTPEELIDRLSDAGSAVRAVFKGARATVSSASERKPTVLSAGGRYTTLTCAACGEPIQEPYVVQGASYCEACGKELRYGTIPLELLTESPEAGYHGHCGSEPGPAWENAIRTLEGDGSVSSD